MSRYLQTFARIIFVIILFYIKAAQHSKEKALGPAFALFLPAVYLFALSLIFTFFLFSFMT